MKLVVRELSPLREALRWLSPGFPAWLMTVLQGQASTVGLPATAIPAPSAPLKILLGPELILVHRYALPLAAKPHLDDAVALFVETATPFGRADVLVHAERLDRRGEVADAVYRLRIVPRDALFGAMRVAGIDPAMVIGIADAAAPDRTDFWPAAFPARRAGRWLALAPLAILLACAATMLTFDRLRDERLVAVLTEATAARLPHLQQLAEELARRRSSRDADSELAALLSGFPSVFNELQGLRQKLPVDTEIVRLAVAGSDTVITVRSPQVLAVAERLGGATAAQVEGAITADPVTGLEQASIRLSARSESRP